MCSLTVADLLPDETPFSCLRFYRCIDPDSTFVTCWTVIFVALVLYICSVGLMYVLEKSISCKLQFMSASLHNDIVLCDGMPA